MKSLVTCLTRSLVNGSPSFQSSQETDCIRLMCLRQKEKTIEYSMKGNWQMYSVYHYSFPRSLNFKIHYL